MVERPRERLIDDPIVRQRLMRYYTSIQILRINGLRTLSAQLAEQEGSVDRRPRRAQQDVLVGDAPAGDGTGPRHLRRPLAAHRRRPGVRLVARRAARRPPASGYPVSPMMSSFFFSRSETIWGGTSQIQRNIVGERILGLPKEPQRRGADSAVDHGRPPIRYETAA